jgi:hypothetical protein
MSLFDIALTGSALVILAAISAAVRRPERRGRYLLVAVLIVGGLFLSLWTLAKGLCCY